MYDQDLPNMSALTGSHTPSTLRLMHTYVTNSCCPCYIYSIYTAFSLWFLPYKAWVGVQHFWVMWLTEHDSIASIVFCLSIAKYKCQVPYGGKYWHHENIAKLMINQKSTTFLPSNFLPSKFLYIYSKVSCEYKDISLVHFQ